MRKTPIFVIFLFVFLVNFLFGQDTIPLHYSLTITKSELSEHVYTLASDAFEGRYTGSSGQLKAEKYILGEFRDYGLEKPLIYGERTFIQNYSLNNCSWSDQRLAIGNNLLRVGRDFLFLGDPVNIQGSFPVIFAGFGIDDTAYSDFRNIDVKGKIMLVFNGEPTDSLGISYISGKQGLSKKGYYFGKAAEAANRGAEGVFIIVRRKSDFRKYLQEQALYDPGPDLTYPAGDNDLHIHKQAFTAFIDLKGAGMLLNVKGKDLLAALHKMDSDGKTLAGSFEGSAEINAESYCQPWPAANVVGMIEGNDRKGQAVVVVAHNDHLGRENHEIYHGADDNASGSAALMEIAQAFADAAKDGFRPRRTVIFLSVSGEEEGLFGSRFYTENPVIPLDSTYACVNIDMIGRAPTRLADSPGYISGFAYLAPGILEVAQQANRECVPGLEDHMDFRRHIRGDSDHYYFTKHGIPTLMYFEGFHPDYHESTDTPDKILYDRMEKIVRAIFVTTWKLANRQEALKIEN